jgi:hypothetical protein
VLDVNGTARMSIASHGMPLHARSGRDSNENADA